MRIPSHIRRVTAEQACFSLIELLIELVALLAITPAILDALNNSSKVNARDTEWALSLQAGRVGLTRMANEVRQSYQLNAATPNSIDFNVTEGSASERVYYQCNVSQPSSSYRECVRLQTTVGGSLPTINTAAPIITNVLNGTTADPVFTYSPDSIDPNYVQLRIELPAAGSLATGRGLSHTIVFLDGAFLRNQTVN